MAQLVVAAAAATVGFAIGGTTGAQIGWIVGSMAGSALFGPDPAQGPRITDGKFSANTYGQPIPWSYGTMRHSAQVLWWSGLHERSEEVGGKGADGETVYHYSCDLLVSAGEGPKGAVLRIWGNGRLIWENDGTPDGRVDAALISVGNVRVYLGDEDQVPDPLYEAAAGAENAVAYRGQCVVMLQGLQLQFSGNRPPSIEVEVASSVESGLVCPVDPIRAVQTQQTQLLKFVNSNFAQESFCAAYDSQSKIYYVVTLGDSGLTPQIEAYSTAGEYPTLIQIISLPKWQNVAIGTYELRPAGVVFDPENRLLRVAAGWVVPNYTALTDIPIEYTWDGSTLTESAAKFNWFFYGFGDFPVNGEFGADGAIYGALSSVYPDSGSVLKGEVGWWINGSAASSRARPHLMNGDQGGVTLRGWLHSDTDGRTNWTADVLYIPKSAGGGYNIAWKCDGWTAYFDHESTVSEMVTDDGTDSVSRAVYLVLAPARRKVYALTGLDGVASVDLDASLPLSATARLALPQLSQTLGARNAVWNARGNGLVVIDELDANLEQLWLIEPDTGETIIGPCEFSPGGIIRAPQDIGDGRFVCTLGDDQVAIIASPGGGSVSGGPVTLQSIVEDLCARAGLPAENLDASAGTDLVSGYKVARQTTARAAIESLRPGYHFDMPESGAELVLRKRGGAAVATIESGELGAHVFTLTGSVTPPYEVEHTNEAEAPRVLELVYVDHDADYDPGVQRASRQTGEASAPLRIEVPVVFAGGHDEAARAAWTLLLEAHASKNLIKLALTHRYEGLDSADPILVPFADSTLRRVRIERLIRARPLLEVEGVLEDAEVYTQTMAGVGREEEQTQSPIQPRADTVLVLLDVPPLRDTDDVLIVYAAMAQAVRSQTWPGAVAFKSIDGSSYDPVLTASAASTLGVTTTPLGGWWGNVWDDENTFDVMLSAGTFSSATDLMVLAGANAIAVQAGDDWEIVQFRDAELVATNTWRLSQLLRGRTGTERAMNGHAVGDRVVLLTASNLQLLTYPAGEIGTPRYYKGITTGQAVSDVAGTAYAFNANSLRPLAPVHIEGTRDGGDLTITWIRRARIFGAWIDGQDVPLDEPVESFEIDIMDGGDVVRTLTAASPSVVYSAADQTTDFGAPQASVAVRIHQISSRVGRGHPGAATI